MTTRQHYAGAPAWRRPYEREDGHLDVSHETHHDAFMRTTLTLDPDVARLLQEQADRTRRSFNEVVNDALRKGLGPEPAGGPKKRVRVVSHAAKLLPGLDRAGFNQLADELETAALLANQKTRRQ